MSPLTVKKGIAAARAHGCKGGRPRLMTPERLRYAQHLMTDSNRSIPSVCRELGNMPASTFHHYLPRTARLSSRAPSYSEQTPPGRG